MRKLASIQVITDIRPIDGKDRIVLATVEGWHVIVTKDFNVGDKVVYCEIDSLMPEKPEFEFLRPKKFKIKTMKMGNAVSQGICFPLSILPPRDTPYEVGEDVTEILGVKHIEETVDDPVPANTAPQKKRSPFVRFLLRFGVFRRMLLPKKETGAFPSEYISKTDENRCLDGSTKILTDQGLIRIADIVNKQLDVKVLSYNQENSTFEYSKIMNYQKYPADNQLIRMHIPFCPFANRKNSIVCTYDHRLLTQDGYKKASEITINDCICYPAESYGDEAIEFIYGMLLGDASVEFERRKQLNGKAPATFRIAFCQGEKQLEYLKFKQSLFGLDNFRIRRSKSGYAKTNVYQGHIPIDDNICQTLINDGCIHDHHFYITKEFCERLTPISLALWYLDDGTCRHLNNDVYKNATYGSPSIEISTNSFSFEEVQLLIDVLRDKFNINSNIRHNKKNGKDYPSIYIPVSETQQFMKLIAPYVPECMRYKLTGDALNIPFSLSNFSLNRTLRPIYTNPLTIESFSLSNFSNNRFVYDIEVEHNHSFVASGIVNHNCQTIPWLFGSDEARNTRWVATEKIDGTSGTWLLVQHRKAFGRRAYDYYVCSRNKRLVMDDGSVYWQIEHKYQIRDKLMNLIGDQEFVAIQGECIGPKVQGNKYKVTEPDMYVFNFITSANGRGSSVRARDMLGTRGFNFVPIIDTNFILPDTVDEMVAAADGTSVLNPKVLREGLVVRSADGKQSFKTVSNKYLLKFQE